ncbi:MAG TPA: winged helix-turn-helix domain-containing protein [Solirubrobacterales bacterium]|nr:winged helix-turn-helix domain-containing protein [Solirubrobacterales bacterium]
MARKRRKVTRRQRKLGKSPQQVLVKALNHPVRVKALTILTDRTASPKEISELLEVPLSNVSYHVRVLEELGLIEIVEEESVRGSVAHFYRSVERPLIDNPDWEKLDPRVRSAVSGYAIETLLSDAAGSLAAGTFDRRGDRHLSRTPLLLDEQGWRKVASIQDKALGQILKEQAAATARLERKGEASIHAVAGLMCFEVPPEEGDGEATGEAT